MIYKIFNPVTGTVDYITGEESDVLSVIEANIAEFMQRESYRFSVACVITVGNDTTWCAADPATHPEVGQYQVFNHSNGAYEAFESLSAALERDRLLREEFTLPFRSMKVVESIPPKDLHGNYMPEQIPVERI